MSNAAVSLGEFRELESIDLWSATIFPGVEAEIFTNVVRTLATESHQGFSGYTTGLDGEIDTFTRTRYPRKKYGILPVAQLVASTHLVAQRFNSPVQIDRLEDAEIRIVLGLAEGYEKTARIHDMEEVRQRLGETSLRAMAADVFAVRMDGAIYTESCAVITGNRRDAKTVYMLAESFGQERFTVEDFDNRKAFVVETAHCASPDPE